MSVPDFVFRIRRLASSFAFAAAVATIATFVVRRGTEEYVTWLTLPFWFMAISIFCWGTLESLGERFYQINLGFEWSQTIVGFMNLVGAYVVLRFLQEDSSFKIDAGQLVVTLDAPLANLPYLVAGILGLVLGLGTLWRTLSYGFGEIGRRLKKRS